MTNVDKATYALDHADVRVTSKPGRTRPHRLAPGLSVELPALVEAGPSKTVGPNRVTLILDEVDGRLGCTEITVHASPGETVSGTNLRTIPIATIVRIAATTLVQQTVESGEGYVMVTPYQPPPKIDVRAGATDEALRFVAASYSLAYALGEPPAKAVERDLGIAKSTATKWISLARERGFLDISADQGRRA